MIVWRISNYADIKGQGGLHAPARWHNKGKPVVYAASSPASALLEILVHLELADLDALPETYRLLTIEAPDDLAVLTLEKSALHPDWRKRPDLTRTAGDAWLREASSALLAVPSAILPYTQNYLINPAHPDAGRIRVVSHAQYPFDARLFR